MKQIQSAVAVPMNRDSAGALQIISMTLIRGLTDDEFKKI
jgi:hypothetical protein